ncbi:MAG TPA: glycosyltransferase family A protein [Methylomirabilota bacterium]|nr:glycosyltransferase family A protein [Methylomirabilota bacterium]
MAEWVRLAGRVGSVWRHQGGTAVVRKVSRALLARLAGETTVATDRLGARAAAGTPSGVRDLSGLVASATPAPDRPDSGADGTIRAVVLAALDVIDRPPGEPPRHPLLDTLLPDPRVAELVKAYAWRLAEAAGDGCRQAGRPSCRVEVQPSTLAADPLALAFLYHLFAFRHPRLEVITGADPGSPALAIADAEIGRVGVAGDGIQTLGFTFPETGRTVARNLGAAVRHRSWEFLGPAAAAPAVDREAPSFSVVLPVYDRTDELVAAVGSVLNQDYPWCELVLVFNGSPPETLALLPKIRRLLKARRYREQVVLLPAAYGAANIPRNIGAFAASGDVIVFLDSDDALEVPGFLSRLADRVRTADPACCLFYPETVEFVNIDRDHWIQGRLVAARPPRCDWETLYHQGNVLNNSGVAVSRARFLAVGGLDPAMSYCEDYELFLRLVGRDRYGLPFPAQVRITLHRRNNEIRFEADRLAWLDRGRRTAEAALAGRPGEPTASAR